MVVSICRGATSAEFENLLNIAHDSIEKRAREEPEYFPGREHNGFELDVCDHLSESAKGTKFEGSIDLVSGLKFPDITVNKYFGVEVKSKKRANDWKSVGNSVLESNRIEDVNRIYMYFGRLVDPAEFRWRLYQECLWNVAVTHSPRYLIDMELEERETIFSKIGMEYDDFRVMEKPISLIVEYFRKNAAKGEEPWWMESSDDVSPATIRLLEQLPKSEKVALKIKAFARFPEIFSKKTDKYRRLATWLVARCSLTSTSLRDQFSAGGQTSISINGKMYENIPKVYQHLYDNFNLVIREILSFEPHEIRVFLNLAPDCISKQEVLKTWTGKVIEHAMSSSPECAEFIYNLFWNKLDSTEMPDEVKEAQVRYGF